MAQSTGACNITEDYRSIAVGLFVDPFPLEFEVWPNVVLGFLAGQHHAGVHQDSEEDSFLCCFRSPDDAAI